MNYYAFGYIIILLFACRTSWSIDVDDDVIYSSTTSPTVSFDQRNSSHSIPHGTMNETDPAEAVLLEKVYPKSEEGDFRLNQNRLQTRILDRRKSEFKDVNRKNNTQEDSNSNQYAFTAAERPVFMVNQNSPINAFVNNSSLRKDSTVHNAIISTYESSIDFNNVSQFDFQIVNSTAEENDDGSGVSENPLFGDGNKLIIDHQSNWREFLKDFEGFHNSSNFCRTRDGRFLPPQLFTWDSCAYCYVYEIRKYVRRKGPWKNSIAKPELGSEIFEILFHFNITELNSTTPQIKLLPAVPSKKLFESVVPDLKFRENWQKCCDTAVNCCHKMLKMPEMISSNMCPRTWDGWQCWKDALPNTEIFESCPDYVYIDTDPTCKKLAVKRCEEDGRWYRKNLNEWSNYSSCGVLPKVQLRITCHLCALSISVLALTPALLIFCCYRQLRVHRITLHKHLFISLLLEACCTIAFQLLQLYNVNIISENNLWCVALTLFRRYARQTNYMWYLCEGYYLHKLLAAAFAEQRSLDIFYLIGWGFPLLPIVVYASIRGQMYQNSHCWEMPIADIEWMMQLPPLLAILINLIFLVNIIRILLSKVRAGNDNEPCQYRMAVRATLMVIPLFGLQYIITIYRPKGQTCDWADVYHIINNIIDGSTGFVVAVIFCFANGEVRNLLRRSWKRKREKHPPFGSTRSSRNSFPFGSRSLSTVQTTYVNTTNNPSRRASSIISMGISSHFGSKSILKTSGTNVTDNQRPDNTKRAERIQKARSVSQILDIVKINESNYSLKFINNKPIHRSDEEGIDNFRENSPNCNHHRPSTIPNHNTNLYGHYIPLEDENITFIDDECSLSGESQQLTLGEIIYNNSRINKSKHYQYDYVKENRKLNLKIEEDIM